MTTIFVDGASSIAKHLRVSATVIGLTVVAFGASASELFIVMTTRISESNSPDLAVGNIIGVGIMRILLVLGIAALIRPIRVNNSITKKEIPLLVLATCAFAATFLDRILDGTAENMFTRTDALLMLMIFGIFIFHLRTIIMHRRAVQSEEDLDAVADIDMSKWKAMLAVFFGLIGLMIGAQLTVAGAAAVAEGVGISERVVALTIVSFGTALPELVIALVALRRGETALAIGSVIGANIFDIGFTMAISTLIFGGFSVASFTYVDLGMMVIAVLALAFFASSDRKIKRSEGAIMLALFLAYMVYLAL